MDKSNEVTKMNAVSYGDLIPSTCRILCRRLLIPDLHATTLEQVISAHRSTPHHA
ncbi:hypothetical protein CY34DRAFT_807438 [Suillus luteus UH-Slu-Lm8-n1]|uniref:Uncharacterized protein n=1 Tax=Suillus luteus UH-Slu-Lm8-n1 TaxID=930992 RepID=A0A0D0B912_9AGAM|nr:hypothetical protein CY34DRAFT_807438 [Suillus luteus UH-Slu-Lm8-n1]